MGLLELIMISVGLSMDAFAVSLCKGLQLKKFRASYTLFIAGSFGLAQGLMPLIGWLMGSQFAKFISPFDHWIVCGLLGVIGIKMILESFSSDKEECGCDGCFIFSPWQIVMLAIATSIDALAVGVSFAFLKVNILFSAAVIAVITFVICFFGVLIGIKFGIKFKKKAEITGGAVLIAIGLKILIEHLIKHV